MAISIPSADDVGPFFRAGTKKPNRRLTAGFSLSALGPTLPESRQASPMTTAQPLTIGAHPTAKHLPATSLFLDMLTNEALSEWHGLDTNGKRCRLGNRRQAVVSPFLSEGHARMSCAA